MYKRSYIGLFIIAIIFVMTACDSKQTESYQGLLMIDHTLYVLDGETPTKDLIVGEKIGEVHKKVKPEVLPKENFSSNYLEVGEAIYSSKEDRNIIIVERKDGTFETMKKRVTK